MNRIKSAAWWILEPYKELIESAPWWLILFNYIWMMMLIAYLVALTA